jgi:hypothetical protein
MREWLRERRIALLFVAIGVPLLLAFAFPDMILEHWGLFILCYVVALPAGIVLNFGWQYVREYAQTSWKRLSAWGRVLVGCLSISALWLLFFVGNGVKSDRLAFSTFETAAVLILWISYVLFGRAVDAAWLRFRRR